MNETKKKKNCSKNKLVLNLKLFNKNEIDKKEYTEFNLAYHSFIYGFAFDTMLFALKNKNVYKAPDGNIM